jgi:MFS family permease
MLCIVQAAADATATRLPLSNLFRENLAHHFLLERPAQFFAWYGVPKPLSQIVLCALLIAALAWAHRILVKHALLRPLTDHDGKRLFVIIISIISKMILGMALLVIAYAVWKDPPTGGPNPGGPSPGMLVFYAVIFAGPWVIAGAAGWAITAWLRRRRKERLGEGTRVH